MPCNSVHSVFDLTVVDITPKVADLHAFFHEGRSDHILQNMWIIFWMQNINFSKTCLGGGLYSTSASF